MLVVVQLGMAIEMKLSIRVYGVVVGLQREMTSVGVAFLRVLCDLAHACVR